MAESLNLEQLVEQVMDELAKRLNLYRTTSHPERLPGTDAADRPPNPAAADAAVQLELEQQANGSAIPQPKWPDRLAELTGSTPARIAVWRSGTRPLTRTMLKLRRDHAAAVDAVYGEVSKQLLDEFSLFVVETVTENTEHYLKRPDLGRIIHPEGVEKIKNRCTMRPQVQIVVSDGLSANAIEANLRDIYPALLDSLKAHGLSWGVPFFVKGGRVACMDHIGEILQPEVLVLLIGERPGLVTAHSLSAYMCYRPRKGVVESDRTVISNIHRGGTPPIEAGAHIGAVLKKMIEQQASGVKLIL
ncbi:ethanolamine ammonia-lyase subunit EutC [Brevibacillus marinus]|uniref:ethanolamine ammonia-lyase subunit EutC n=1 Tax=Brevibacillus marinus TaxID=2496837 RepID=UPI000F82BEBB|nr:ethanolamine ammonia-lyase subunit EutC [Brevibacillus marinus]